MRTRVVSLMTCSLWRLGIVMFLTCSLSLQAQLKEVTTTESRDVTGATSQWRVIVTRTEQDGSTTETRTVEVPSINGGYPTWIETEQQTIQPNPNATTVVKRQYSRDSYGNQRLLAVTEEQKSTAADGRETVVRTTSSADVNASQYIDTHLQVVQREVQETVPTGDDTRQTTSTVYRQTTSGFQPVQRVQRAEQRKGDVAEQQTTVLVPDGGGKFVPIYRADSTTTMTASGQTKDERIYGDMLGQGNLTVVERNVTSESNDAHTIMQTYSAILPGASLDPGTLVLVQQVSTSQQTVADGSSERKQQMHTINLGNPASGLHLTTSISEVWQPASNGQSKGQIIVRSSDGSGAFPVRITDIHGTRIIP